MSGERRYLWPTAGHEIPVLQVFGLTVIFSKDRVPVLISGYRTAESRARDFVYWVPETTVPAPTKDIDGVAFALGMSKDDFFKECEARGMTIVVRLPLGLGGSLIEQRYLARRSSQEDDASGGGR